ncbi:MAG TPA: hypothetical protein VFP61_04525 [Acidimicrobiales bacterium]|nr:hypothetical protein [Acidimicrobiales bacterium]
MIADVAGTGTLRPWVRPTLAVVTLLVCVGLFGLAAFLARTASHERRDASAYAGGRTTAGTVIAATTLCGHICDHRAVVEYSVGGTTYHVIGAPQDATPQMGARVTVSYLPTDPAAGRDLDAHRSITALVIAGAVVAGVAGLVVAVTGGFALVRWGRR